ncbi:MAG: MASE3 domain-containing protein [Thermodesulfobacteriota bacterium]
MPSGILERYYWVLFGILILTGICLTSLYSFLLFHSLAELFSIVIAFGIFMVAWHSRRLLDNNYLLFLGIAYLFVAAIDVVHTLAYKGMGVFQGYDANLPTQLWILARYVESLSLFVAPFFFNRKLRANAVFPAYAMGVALLFGTVFHWSIFPDCFIEGKGLTPFKKVSEYIISLILLGSVVLLVRKRREFDGHVLIWVVWSIIATIISELAFTFYVSVYGLSNLVGHLFKIISFYLIYKAIIETGFARPYDLLWRNLRLSEEALREDITERKRVEAERGRLIRDLQEALAKVKQLSGLLPICASCKKVRDDKGYWTKIETYIRDHSEAEFSHGFCPECEQRLYPDYSGEGKAQGRNEHA